MNDQKDQTLRRVNQLEEDQRKDQIQSESSLSDLKKQHDALLSTKDSQFYSLREYINRLRLEQNDVYSLKLRINYLESALSDKDNEIQRLMVRLSSQREYQRGLVLVRTPYGLQYMRL